MLLIVGGVYDSPEAQEYWSQRFGDLFSNIRSLQKTAVTAEPSKVVTESLEPVTETETTSETEDEDVKIKTTSQYPVYPVLYYPYSSLIRTHQPLLLTPTPVFSNQI